MAAREGDVFHFRQQARAQIYPTHLLINRHAFDNVGRKTRASHQLRTGQRLDKQNDIVVQPQTAVGQ